MMNGALRLGLAVGLLSANSSHLASHAAPPPARRLHGQIVYSTSQVFIVSAARSDAPRQLTEGPGPHFDPEFSPDGKKIVYRDSHFGINRNDEIYVMNRDGSQKVDLTHTPDNDWSPSFSPDGRQIVYASEKDTLTVCLWVMNADGSDQHRLTKGVDEYPSWSTHGLIAFSRLSSNNGNIFTIRPDGSGLQQLTRSPEQDESPVFSPDGRWIAFERGFEGHRDVWLMHADGSGAHAIVATAADEVQPAWSPDGRALLYARNQQLYIVSRDGSNRAPLGLRATISDWRAAARSRRRRRPSTPRRENGSAGTATARTPIFAAHPGRFVTARSVVSQSIANAYCGVRRRDHPRVNAIYSVAT